MAEGQTPTFKLVLVGDGGTGKVSFASGPSGSYCGLTLWRATADLVLSV